MRTSIWLGIGVCLWTQAVWGQRPVTSIASPVDLTGQTVTVPVRVMNAPRGAASLSSVTLYLKSDAGLEAEFWVSVDFGSGALQVFDNFTTPGAPRYASYPPPTVAVGSRTGLNWGFAGLLEISGYTLAKTGNEVALDLTIKRFAPYTGMKHFTPRGTKRLVRINTAVLGVGYRPGRGTTSRRRVRVGRWRRRR